MLNDSPERRPPSADSQSQVPSPESQVPSPVPSPCSVPAEWTPPAVAWESSGTDASRRRLVTVLLLLLAAGIFAGVQNALAGGGSFVTLGMLVILAGLDPRAANITSTIALFPGQVATGYAGRRAGDRDARACRSARCSASASPAACSGPACCWRRRPRSSPAWCPGWCCSRPACSPGARSSGVPSRAPLAAGPAPPAAQFLIAIYGGYFGGGIGFLMLAALTVAGPAGAAGLGDEERARRDHERVGGGDIPVLDGRPLAARRRSSAPARSAAGCSGPPALTRVNERWLRVGVIVLGAALEHRPVHTRPLTSCCARRGVSLRSGVFPERSCARVFLSSSMAEHPAVNRRVVGSSPT